VIEESQNWLSLKEAAKRFGYTNPVSFRNRIRQLRSRGKVLDLGQPPTEYKAGRGHGRGKIVLYWLNPGIALLRGDAPRELFIPRRGKRRLDAID
jgi:transposase-like protein